MFVIDIDGTIAGTGHGHEYTQHLNRALGIVLSEEMAAASSSGSDRLRSNCKGKYNERYQVFYKEYITDNQGNKVVPPGMGLSTFISITQPGRWWKLPAGSPIPVGLRFTNDHENHYVIEPVKTIPVDDYTNLVMQTSSYWEKV